MTDDTGDDWKEGEAKMKALAKEAWTRETIELWDLRRHLTYMKYEHLHLQHLAPLKKEVDDRLNELQAEVYEQVQKRIERAMRE